MIKFILLDIEGTTTSIDFVHKVLFPYSDERMETYLNENQNIPEIAKAIKNFKAGLDQYNYGKAENLADVVRIAKAMIKDDVKYGPLKILQGFIWEYGYKSGDVKGHVYPEVKEVFEKWKEQGFKLGIYSSGSVLAQKLIFGFTEFGDLTPYLSHYFDTEVGHKREVASYKTIAQKLNLEPAQILFLSDRFEELDAAQGAGMQTVLVQRDQELDPKITHQQIKNFNEVNLLS
ncbi:MAG: acireductone synthase [Pseudobdellovibrio sp.]